MSKRIKQLGAVLLAVILCIPSAAQAASVPVNPTIRLGLYYGKNALPGANLANSVGSGYRFGYFDSEKQFFQVGYTAETKISMVKTQNVSYGYIAADLKNGYSDAITSDIVVGCYHVQLPTTYAAFDGALVAASQIPDAFPAWVNGTYYVRVGAYAESAAAAARAAQLGAGAIVAGTSSNSVSVVKTGTNTVLFQFDGGAGMSLAVNPGLDDGVKTVTIFQNNSYYGAFQYERRDGGNITVVNFVPLEDYVKGVVVKEMSRSWPLEALKAQAVCARTYTIISFDNHKKDGFELCNTTDCQAYAGIGEANDNSNRAVDETAGKYVWYGNEMAHTNYFSNDGGATESPENVWSKAVPYLVGVKDPYEESITAMIPKHRWTVTVTKAELTEKLRARGYGCADVVDFYVSERTPTGNVKAFTFLDAAGKTWTISNATRGLELCRTMLGLRSINYSITGSSGGSYYVDGGSATIGSVTGAYAVDGTGNVSQIVGTPYVITESGTVPLAAPATTATVGDSFTINGSGWGHLVGMSQWGAYAMAKQNMTYEQILKFYFTGVEVR